MTPGGLWDSSKYEIKALIKQGGKVNETVQLDFVSPSTFSGSATVDRAGDYEIIVYAYDAQTGNTGVDKVPVTVR